jgi:hypothetical protein
LASAKHAVGFDAVSDAILSTLWGANWRQPSVKLGWGQAGIDENISLPKLEVLSSVVA